MFLTASRKIVRTKAWKITVITLSMLIDANIARETFCLLGKHYTIETYLHLLIPIKPSLIYIYILQIDSIPSFIPKISILACSNSS